MTPQLAIESGANFVVIGRPITGAWGRGAAAMSDAARAIAAEISG
jgi:orotidine-5'-phosphate decarboxylase